MSEMPTLKPWMHLFGKRGETWVGEHLYEYQPAPHWVVHVIINHDGEPSWVCVYGPNGRVGKWKYIKGSWLMAFAIANHKLNLGGCDAEAEQGELEPAADEAVGGD